MQDLRRPSRRSLFSGLLRAPHPVIRALLPLMDCRHMNVSIATMDVRHGQPAAQLFLRFRAPYNHTFSSSISETPSPLYKPPCRDPLSFTSSSQASQQPTTTLIFALALHISSPSPPTSSNGHHHHSLLDFLRPAPVYALQLYNVSASFSRLTSPPLPLTLCPCHPHTVYAALPALRALRRFPGSTDTVCL